MGIITQYTAGIQELRAHAPELPLHTLLLRILMWKAYRLAHASPLVRLHDQSCMRLHATPRDHGIRTGIFLFHEDYEPSVRCAIDRFVQPGATCYDIGANLGLWSLRMAERAGATGQVFSFEPVPECYHSLVENAELSNLNNITVMPFALSASTGPSVIYIPGDVGRGALAPETSDDRRVEVNLRRLDEVWCSQGRPSISFVKMDVEGSEPLVLQGGREFFDTVRPVVCCEINPEKLRGMGFAGEDIRSVFTSLRYKTFVWSDRVRDLVPEEPGGSANVTRDVVFIPGDRTDQSNGNRS
jgi:FkbM family methyltransferase